MTGCCWFEFFLISALKVLVRCFALLNTANASHMIPAPSCFLGMVPVAFSSGWTIIKVSLGKGEF